VAYYVYILASHNRRLYIGVTNSLESRAFQHKTGAIPGFASRYKINKLVYCEDYQYIRDAIAREKSLKGLLRVKKIALIESVNPEWDDLAEGWYTELEDSSLRSE
jgi:putative endonuclease